ncbi:TRAP transporter small permease [Saccharomonospora iraqiensis]|uniref:TRAP transporter small permease n=1 Tax=Saccharomonospora iraqiensis TaxID=52698 RepID=UPI00022DED57|nr:TRAP transporter small permease subunit [Saccharomonospora iraqiensis]
MAEHTDPPRPGGTARPDGTAREGGVRTLVRRVSGALSAAEAVVGGLMLVTIFTLMLVQAVQRYLPTGGWVWTGELARFGLVWLTFAMAGYLMGRDEHVTLKLIDYAVRGRVHRLVLIFANVLVAVVCVNLAYEAFVLVVEPTGQSSPAMGIPMNYFYVIPLAGLVLTTVRSAMAVVAPPRPSGEEQPA